MSFPNIEGSADGNIRPACSAFDDIDSEDPSEVSPWCYISASQNHANRVAVWAYLSVVMLVLPGSVQRGRQPHLRRSQRLATQDQRTTTCLTETSQPHPSFEQRGGTRESRCTGTSHHRSNSAKATRGAPAICAWDGNWTYAELDTRDLQPGVQMKLIFRLNSAADETVDEVTQKAYD